jgi:hypothetical protein
MVGTLLWLLVISVPVAAGVLYFAIAGRSVKPSPAPTAASAPSVPAGQPASSVPEAPPVAAPAAVASSAEPPTDPPIGAPAAIAPAAQAPGDRAPGDVLLVGLSVRRSCWVSASVDGQKTIERLMQAGEQRLLEVRRELAITAGDASALDLTFNGTDARPLGKSGEVVTARFNLSNFKNYLQVR